MQIKKVKAKSTQEALAIIKKNYPDDAVILSNNAVSGGVEVLVTDAASATMPSSETKNKRNDNIQDFLNTNDFRPELNNLNNSINQVKNLLQHEVSQLILENFKASNPLCFEIVVKLLSLGFTNDMATLLVKHIDANSNMDKAWEMVENNLNSLLPEHQFNYKKDFLGLMFLGLQGGGKTTALLKLAFQSCIDNEVDARLSTLDALSVGKEDILQKHAKILGVDYYKFDLAKQLNNFNNKKLTFFDVPTELVNQKNHDLTMLLDSNKVFKLIVMPASVNSSCHDDFLANFNSHENFGVIVSMRDLSKNIGAVISLCIQHGLPIIYTSSTGELVSILEEVVKTEFCAEVVSAAKSINVDNNMRFFEFIQKIYGE